MSLVAAASSGVESAAHPTSESDVVLQRSAEAVRPAPADAWTNRGRMHDDGCQLKIAETEPPRCVYGDRRSDTTVVLVGDSTALHYFPALHPIARTRGWRLVGMSKGGCSLAVFPRWLDDEGREFTECSTWRRNALARIVDEAPDMVIVAGRADGQVIIDGDPLPPAESERVIEDGFVRSFRRIRETGATIVLMASSPIPEVEAPICVEQHMDHLGRCATPRDRALGYAHNDLRAAERVPSVQVINVNPLVCNDRVCPAVIDDVLVYRRTFHFTATWAKTMIPFIRRELPDP